MSDLLDGAASENDLAFESALRPTSLSEFIGQSKVCLLYTSPSPRD